MPKPELQTFEVTCVRLDDEGKKVAFVGMKKDAKDTKEAVPQLVLAPNQDAARIKVLTTLAMNGQYDPDKPDVEVQIGPFSQAR